MARPALTVGVKAPPFPGQKTLAGKWVVLYFYPKDFTSGCTTEACEFSAALPFFKKLGATVIGVSPDTEERHQKFAEKHGLEITLLADPDREVLGRYGAWGKKNMYGRVVEGVLRSTVLIDPAGKIAHHWPKVKAAGHAEEVRKKLEELRGR
jgi:thioredoxin-dependent peroxiredoxin